MQIQLKQPEIVAALRQYIAQQGINLTGKDVGMAFTAGRKESGLSVEITIEDPALGQDTTQVTQRAPEQPVAAETAAPKAKPQPKAEAAPEPAIPAPEVPMATKAVKRPPWEAETEAAEPQPAADDSPKAKTTSLFS